MGHPLGQNAWSKSKSGCGISIILPWILMIILINIKNIPLRYSFIISIYVFFILFAIEYGLERKRNKVRGFIMWVKHIILYIFIATLLSTILLSFLELVNYLRKF